MMENRYKDLVSGGQGIGTLEKLYLNPESQEMQQLGAQARNFASMFTPQTKDITLQDMIAQRSAAMELPEQKTQAEILQELQGLSTDPREANLDAQALAFSRFGQAMSNAPGMSLGQAFNVAAPLFTETILENRRKQNERKELLALQARRESQDLEKELRAQSNQISLSAIDAFSSNQAKQAEIQADALQEGLKTALELNEGKLKPEYEITSAYDQNQIGDKNALLNSLVQFAKPKDGAGSSLVRIEDQWYTTEEAAKYGFNFIEDEGNNFAKELLQSLGKEELDDVVANSKVINITQEINGKPTDTTALQTPIGNVVKLDGGQLIPLDPNNFAFGKQKENVVEIESNIFRTVERVTQDISPNIQDGAVITTINPSIYSQSTRERDGMLKYDDFFVTRKQDVSPINIENQTVEALQFSQDRLEDNLKLRDLLESIVGKTATFRDQNQAAYGFMNRLKENLGNTVGVLANGAFGFDGFNFTQQAKARKDVQAAQRILATAWAENPRYAIAERTALISELDRVTGDKDATKSTLDKYFVNQDNAMAAIRKLLVQTNNMIEMHSSILRPKEDGYLKQHEIPTGKSGDEFALDGKFQDGQFVGDKLSVDAIRLVRDHYMPTAQGYSQDTVKKVNGLKFRVTPRLYRSMLESMGRDSSNIPMDEKGIILEWKDISEYYKDRN